MSTLPAPEIPKWEQPQIFYGKPLTLHKWGTGRRYKWGDQWVSSVTTILRLLDKPQLIQWAADMAVEHIERVRSLDAITLSEARTAHERIRDEAGDIGSLVHDRARAMLDPVWQAPAEDPAIAQHPQAMKALQALADWRQMHVIEPLGIERRIFSAQHMYGGTVDFFGRIDGELGVLDFKTGNGVYDEAWWQTCGYEIALLEEMPTLQREGHNAPLARWIVHLSKKDGSFTVHRRCEDDAADHTVWLSLVALHQSLGKARKHPQPRRKAA